MARSGDPRLRLMLITDGCGDPDRIAATVTAAVAGGVRAVQLREPRWTARQLLQACERLCPVLDAVGGWLLVNDRIDVAAARAAHGCQLGHRSLPPALARELLGQRAVVGYSAHDEGELAEAATAGCNFALLSPVWQTTSKPDAAFLGPERAARLTAAARLPVLWLGGVDETTIAATAAVDPVGRPCGFAVRSAIMARPDPEQAARSLLAALPALPH